MRSPDTCRCGPEEFDVPAIETRRDFLSGRTCHGMSEGVSDEFLRRRRLVQGWNRMYKAFSVCASTRAQIDQELEYTMPLAPPAVMVEPPPDPAPDADPIQRGVSLGLRARSPVGSSVSNAPSSSRKETYMWEGYRKYSNPLRICHLNSAHSEAIGQCSRLFETYAHPKTSGYEIDEDTQPEWIHASNKGRRGTKTLNMDGARSPSLASTTSSVPSTLIAQMIAATKLIVKLPVTVTEQTLFASRQLTSTGFEPSPSPPPADEDTPTPMDIDGDLSALSRFGLGPAVIEKITALTILEAPIELLLQPPYVVEPDLTTIIRIDDAFPVALKAAFVDLRKTVLRTFYGRNTFQCAFHTTITKVNWS